MKELIDKAERIVILTHMAPDGDAMGSALALWHYCKDRFAVRPLCCKTASAVRPQAKPAVGEVTVIVPNAFPAFLGWMPGAEEVKIYEKEASACDRLIAEADLFLCTDFNDPKRIGPMGEKMMANAAPKVLIDHHLMDRCAVGPSQSDCKTADAERPASPDGLWVEEHVDSGASSACEIVYKLIAAEAADRCAVRPSQSDCKTADAERPSQSDCKTANAVRPGTEPSDCKTADAVGRITNDELRITNEIATCIYTGLMTDTGNFSYNSTNAELYDIIASLLRAGVKKDEIYNAVFNQFSSDRMRLAGYALYRKMRIYPEYHLALITLSADELDQYHYQTGDCEGIVNMPLQIADVYYSVFMREERAKPGTPKSRIRISLRSQGDRPVNIWANEVFHGGGHMNASGGEVLGSPGYAVRLFEQSYKKYLKV